MAIKTAPWLYRAKKGLGAAGPLRCWWQTGRPEEVPGSKGKQQPSLRSLGAAGSNDSQKQAGCAVFGCPKC